MHPELQRRMRELGIGLNENGSSSEAEKEDTPVESFATEAACAGGSSSSTSTPKAPPSHNEPEGESTEPEKSSKSSVSTPKQQPPPSPSAGLDPSVTDLLLQLDSLDARAKALSKKDKSSEVDRPGRTEASIRPTGKASVRSESLGEISRQRRPAPIAEETGEDLDESATCSVAQTVARQHPLQSLALGKPSGGASDVRWHGARGRRDNVPPRPPASVHKAPQPHQVLDVAPAYGEGYPGGFAHSGQHVSSASGPIKGKTAGSCVSLPSLKPSASAPGRIGSRAC